MITAVSDYSMHFKTDQPIDHIEQEEIFSLPPASKQQERCCRSTNERTDGRQLISIRYSPNQPTNQPIVENVLLENIEI
ncbi:hypothetical protein T05_9586 [Trichinella murrelli]|uniref:Uncharacterized protein n=1 Tax=Trichinella murrelli TaxID=144512 RepID=A0A0V0TTD9_9BILA|nr:hypothetical protein T05_9586 [Trichinella murrelli]